MTSNRGPFRVSKRDLTRVADGQAASLVSLPFDLRDGLATKECNGGFQPAAWRSRGGRLWFPTMEGIATVDPGHLYQAAAPPSVSIDRIVANGRAMDPSGPIEVPPGFGKLELSFAAANLRSPERVRYRYILDGFEREWTEAGNRRTAFYTNIPPGSYSFRVVACDADGHCSSATSAAMVLRPNFYQTPLFGAASALLLGAMAVDLYWARMRRLQALERTLRRLVEERTHELAESEHRFPQLNTELEVHVHERTVELLHANQALSAENAERSKVEQELRKAVEVAHIANRAKSEFLANMSHEIRTPLNGILGIARLALDNQPPQTQREDFDTIQSSAEALITVINDILDFARVDADRLELHPRQFPLRDCLEDSIRAVAITAENSGLDLLLDMGADVPEMVYGDPDRIRQVTLNLLGNAIKFTEHGEVVLTIAVEDGGCTGRQFHVQVKDTGIGIPAAKIETIFDAFTQVDSSSTRQYGGAGLGLAISARLVRLMKGQIWVESEPGMGSTFHFTVPLCGAPEAAWASPSTEALPHFARLRALIVEPNESHANILTSLLRGFEVESEVVPGVPEAVRSIGDPARAVDLVIAGELLIGAVLSEVAPLPRSGGEPSPRFLAIASHHTAPELSRGRCEILKFW